MELPPQQIQRNPAQLKAVDAEPDALGVADADVVQPKIAPEVPTQRGDMQAPQGPQLGAIQVGGHRSRCQVAFNEMVSEGFQTPMTDRAWSDPERRARVIASEPVGRIGKPEEIAEAVVWLCSDAASFVTGHAMSVDGGLVAQ